jgi:hypothetical protein
VPGFAPAQVRQYIPVYREIIRGFSLAPDEKTLVTIGEDRDDPVIKVWELPAGHLITSFPARPGSAFPREGLGSPRRGEFGYSTS